MKKQNFGGHLIYGLLITILLLGPIFPASAAYRFSQFKGRPPIHQLGSASGSPAGVTPDQIKKAYGLPSTGGHGTIAIVGAYDDSDIENDLNIFDHQFNLPDCTVANKCLEKHVMEKTSYDSGWAMETALDVEWAHAIAPKAKILLVEAKTPSGNNLLDAIDYARKQKGVAAISMSWGGAEFSDETTLDDHFSGSSKDITFFASSGDSGTGVEWPAVSPYVTAVGGTLISWTKKGELKSETAWSGSGGGVSAFESMPDYQTGYSISKANGHRAIPDVSYCADPHSGFSIYHAHGKTTKAWYVVGGTSAGAPQWAAIESLGLSADNDKFYKDKASTQSGQYFRDIKSGSNGDCGYYCNARSHYDYVTGLGSPLTVNF